MRELSVWQLYLHRLHGRMYKKNTLFFKIVGLIRALATFIMKSFPDHCPGRLIFFHGSLQYFTGPHPIRFTSQCELAAENYEEKDVPLAVTSFVFWGVRNLEFNSLRPSDTIWRHRSGSTLAQVMACCLTAPSHYLNQYWLIISEVLWDSY